MPGRLRTAVLAAALAGLAPAPAAAEGALTVYGGWFTENYWEDFFLSPDQLAFRDGWILVVAPSWDMGRPLPDHLPRLSMEVEGQVGRFFGDQHNWEVNALVAARYRMTGRNAAVRTSLAFGIGPSWASRRPRLEETLNDKGETRRWLVYWYLEAAMTPRSWGPWTAVVRLHHRSGAWGMVADNGGSNVPSLGIRRRF